MGVNSLVHMDDVQRFFIFLKRFAPDWDWDAKFYRELMYTVTRKRGVTAAPRGSGKTSICSRWYVLYLLTEGVMHSGEKTEVMIISESEKLALEHLGWVKKELEVNKELRGVYGDLVPRTSDSEVWSRDLVELKNGARAYALGSSAQIRGYHPSHMIVDDLESKKNMDTPEKLVNLKEWFFRSLMGCCMPHTKVAVIGTVIARTSLLVELLTSKSWFGRKFKALNQREDGELYSIIPNRWSVEWLLERKEELGEWAFEAEYQNAPRPATDAVIKIEWMKRYTAPVSNWTEAPVVQRYIGVDPAVTEDRWGCDSAIAVFSRTSNNLLWEELLWAGKVSGPNLIRRIMDIYYLYARDGVPVTLGVEEAATQKFVRQGINELDSEIVVIPLRPHADKITRLMDVSRYFERGMVMMKTEWAIEDIVCAPYGNMNVVDAIVYVLKMVEQSVPELVGRGKSSPLVKKFSEMDDLSLELYTGLSYNEQTRLSVSVPNDILKRKRECEYLGQMLDGMIF